MLQLPHSNFPQLKFIKWSWCTYLTQLIPCEDFFPFILYSLYLLNRESVLWLSMLSWRVIIYQTLGSHLIIWLFLSTGPAVKVHVRDRHHTIGGLPLWWYCIIMHHWILIMVGTFIWHCLLLLGSHLLILFSKGMVFTKFSMPKSFWFCSGTSTEMWQPFPQSDSTFLPPTICWLCQSHKPIWIFTKPGNRPVLQP